MAQLGRNLRTDRGYEGQRKEDFVHEKHEKEVSVFHAVVNAKKNIPSFAFLIFSSWLRLGCAAISVDTLLPYVEDTPPPIPPRWISNQTYPQVIG